MAQSTIEWTQMTWNPTTGGDRPINEPINLQGFTISYDYGQLS